MDKATQEKAVREMCEILMDSEVDLDDKHLAFVTLAVVLFPEQRYTCWGVALKILCDGCRQDSTVIDLLEVAAQKSLLSRDEIDEIAYRFNGVIADSLMRKENSG